MTIHVLLREFIKILNKCGSESQEVKDFLKLHEANREFIEIAKIAIQTVKNIKEKSNA